MRFVQRMIVFACVHAHGVMARGAICFCTVIDPHSEPPSRVVEIFGLLVLFSSGSQVI